MTTDLILRKDLGQITRVLIINFDYLSGKPTTFRTLQILAVSSEVHSIQKASLLSSMVLYLK